jgi:predicted Zn-dependent peptidase
VRQLKNLVLRPALVLALGLAPSAHAEDAANRCEMYRLANGMRWIAAPLDARGEVTIVFYVATGTDVEAATTRGATATLVELWRSEAAEMLAPRGAAPTAFFANPDFTAARATWPSAELAEAVAFAAAHWFRPDGTRFGKARASALAARDRALQGHLRLYWELCRSAFAVHPYGRPYFGEKGELERLSEGAFRDHIAAQLVPANLVGAVTGDFDGTALRSALEREFASLPAVAPPVPLDASEPPQRGERRVVLADAGVSGLAIGFRKDAGASASIAAWDILLDVWQRRLRQRLASQQAQISRFDSGQAPAMKRPNLMFALWVTGPSVDLKALETAALDELARVATTPLDAGEIEEAKRRLAGDPQTPDARTFGQHLADWLVMTGDWRPAFGHSDRLRAVTADQVLVVAREVLRPDNRTVITSSVASPAAR